MLEELKKVVYGGINTIYINPKDMESLIQELYKYVDIKYNPVLKWNTTKIIATDTVKIGSIVVAHE